MYSALRDFVENKHQKWLAQRAQLFVRLTRPAAGQRVLDLGGSSGAFMERVRADADVRVTVADLEEVALERAQARGFDTVLLDEGTALPFADGEYDLVVCNSVIEHVTLPKEDCVTKQFSNRDWVDASLKNQEAFAKEVRRVGRGYFVQTPHRAFPIEAHTWLPFVGWMPHNATVGLVRVTNRAWVKQCVYVDWNLLGERQLRDLFPGASIHVERVAGLPKSLIAYQPARS